MNRKNHLNDSMTASHLSARARHIPPMVRPDAEAVPTSYSRLDFSANKMIRDVSGRDFAEAQWIDFWPVYMMGSITSFSVIVLSILESFHYLLAEPTYDSSASSGLGLTLWIGILLAGLISCYVMYHSIYCWAYQVGHYRTPPRAANIPT